MITISAEVITIIVLVTFIVGLITGISLTRPIIH
jgi:hypothetical protein